MRAAGIWRSMRPKQWVKNLLVVAVPALDGSLFTLDGSRQSAVGFVAWCLAASGAYLLNDAWDAERDRLHPTKKMRPVAAGIVPIPLAQTAGTLSIVAAAGLAVISGWAFFAVLCAYILHTFAYSLWLKRIATVEMVSLASGFVLRAVAGAVIVGATISSWFFAIVAGGALLLASGKRLAEMQHGSSTRAVLSEYTEGYLRIVISAAAAGAVTSYMLWVFEGAYGGSVVAQISILPYLTALLRYTQHAASGKGGEPEEVVLRDRIILANGAAWLACMALGLLVGTSA